MSGKQVLRVGLLYMMQELSYKELAFHLEDSSSFRTFAHCRSEPSIPGHME